MIEAIAKELERLGSSVDLLGENNAKGAVFAALDATRVSIGAIMAHVYYRTTCPKPRSGPLPESDTVPCFVRFTSAFDDEKVREALKISSELKLEDHPTVKNWDQYYFDESKGVWTWLCQKNCPVWISDTFDEESRKNRSFLVNDADEANNLPNDHFIFFPATRAIITIPFEHTVEQSGETWGFLDLEFSERHERHQEQYEALRNLSHRIADLVWKYRAWDENRKGTESIIAKFKLTCEELKKGGLTYKTGLFAPCANSAAEGPISRLVNNAFTDANIYLVASEYLPGAKQAEMKRSEHFGVFDISNCEGNALLLLGALLSQGRPSLVLVNGKDDAERPWLVKELAVTKGTKPNHVVHFYTYEMSEEEGLKFRRIVDSKHENTKKDWTAVWTEFFKEVKEQTDFRSARNYPDAREDSDR